MKEVVISKRYALALLKLASEANSLDDTRKALDAFADLLAGDRRTFMWFCDEENQRSKRQLLVRELSGIMNLGSLVPKFLEVLIQNERIGLIQRMRTIFGALVDQKTNISRGCINAADEESALSIRDKIANILTVKTKNKVILSVKKDPSLIGGLKLKLGSTVWDASIARKLNEIKEQLCQ